MKIVLAASLLAVAPTLAAANVLVTDPWERASILADRPGAAYLTLASDTGDRLIGIETPTASRVLLHGTETDAGGASRMVFLTVGPATDAGWDDANWQPVTAQGGASEAAAVFALSESGGDAACDGVLRLMG